MKTRRMRILTGAIAALLGGVAWAQVPLTLQRTNLGEVVVSWPATPGGLYQLQASSNLNAGWAPLGGASGVPRGAGRGLAHAVAVEPGARFVRLTSTEAAPAAVYWLNPRDGSIAVRRDGALQMAVRNDGTLDPESIRLDLGTGTPVGLNDRRLVLTNDLLTYTPGPGEVLGGFGDDVFVGLRLADTSGRELTNCVWSFRLEREVVFADDARFFGAPLPSAVIPAEKWLRLELLSVTSNSCVFLFSGSTSRLFPGAIVVSVDPIHTLRRTVLSFVEDPTTHIVTVETAPAPLAAVFRQGSVRHVAGVPPSVRELGAGLAIDPPGELQADVPLANVTFFRDAISSAGWSTGQLRLGAHFVEALEFANGEIVDADLDTTLTVEIQGALHLTGTLAPGAPARRFAVTVPLADLSQQILMTNRWFAVTTTPRLSCDALGRGEMWIDGTLAPSVRSRMLTAMNAELRRGQVRFVAAPGATRYRITAPNPPARATVALHHEFHPQFTLTDVNAAVGVALVTSALELQGTSDAAPAAPRWQLAGSWNTRFSVLDAVGTPPLFRADLPHTQFLLWRTPLGD